MVKATKSAQTTKFTSYMIFDKFESIVAIILNKLPEKNSGISIREFHYVWKAECILN